MNTRKVPMWTPLVLSILVCLVARSFCGDITFSAFDNVVDVMPAAFGDFNSDELTDLFVIYKRSVVQILLGSTTEPYFKKGYNPLECTFENYIITSIVPGDFDGDALMDALVTAIRNGSSRGAKVFTQVFILWGGLTTLSCPDENAPLFNMTDEPLAIHHNNNVTVDLFGVNEEGQRGFWIFQQVRGSYKFKPMAHSHVDSKLRVPHSHAFLDLNDDKSADLYLTAEEGFEIWLWDNESSDFVFNDKIDLPPGVRANQVGQTLFMDVEISGKMDQVIPVCFEVDSDYYCKNSSLYVYSDKRWYNLNVNFQDGDNHVWGFAKNGPRYTDTITLRGGDFNLDGYPDMLATLAWENDQRSFLLENVKCETKCDGFTRTFKIQWGAFGSANANTVMGAFYDFFQDGILDVIFVHRPSGPRSQYNISAFKNSLDYDANFIKVMVIAGLINNEIELPPTSLGTKRHTFGTNLPGPKISYQTTTQEGSPRTGVTSQLPQSAHFSLGLPYTIFGLGRTPNFVEDLIIGIFNETRTWTQIIPNSQLVVIPYPADSPYRWRAQLFVTPSKIILQSVIALLGTCLVIIFIILILHLKERREDKIEKLQESHRFHFDAM